MSIDQNNSSSNLPYSAYLRRALLSSQQKKITNSTNENPDLMRKENHVTNSLVVKFVIKKERKYS